MCHDSHIWLSGMIYIIPQLEQRFRLLRLPLLSQAASQGRDLRAPSQHSAPHLSDRCLPPKQWVITALHLSGRTHLVWSAAFSLLFPVMAWHPQSAYQAPFFRGGGKHGTQMLCLCLALSACACRFLFPTPLLGFFPLFLSVSLTQTPQSKEQADYVREKRKWMICEQGNKERGHLSSSPFASWLNVYPCHGVIFFLLLPSTILWCQF